MVSFARDARGAVLSMSARGVTQWRIARVIGRLNVGGPAIQAIQLTRAMVPHGYVTELITGSEGADEGNMNHLAAELGVRPIRITSMQREVGWRDLIALYLLRRLLLRSRPDIVHTEAAKAGALGRLSTLLIAPKRRPIIVHTFHGHSLEGYFSARRARFFLSVERFLAARTDLLIAVSTEVKADLVRLGVTDADRIAVVPVGLELGPFLADGELRDRLRTAKRAEWGLDAEDVVVTLIARLVPIKRVDRFLEIASLLASRDPGMKFVVVGSGELREQLMSSATARALANRLVWAGLEQQMRDVCFASDVVVLTSDNEGTPMSLIEAQAAGVPVVGTRVGGMASAVREGVGGVLVEPDDLDGFATGVLSVLPDRRALGDAGRADMLSRFGVERLSRDLAELYSELLARRVSRH